MNNPPFTLASNAANVPFVLGGALAGHYRNAERLRCRSDAAAALACTASIAGVERQLPWSS